MLPMRDYIKRGPYDELWTPSEALQPLIKYLPKSWAYWDCAPGSGQLIEHLRQANRIVYNAVEADFFKTDLPHRVNMIITNPPYSKKAKFLERCVELEIPWALLLPVTTLGVKRCQKFLVNAEILFLPKRIDFTGKKNPWFAVAWFTEGLEIGKQITFVEE